jgi:hypothetical protein
MYLFGFAALIVFQVVEAACASEQRGMTKGSLDSASVWQSVRYDQFTWDPNKMPDASDFARAARFFGPSTNSWGKINLALYEGLFTRIHEPSLFVQRTNTSAQEYRLLYWPSWSPPLILRFYRGREGAVLRIYAWTRPKAPYATEPPFMAEQLRPQRDWEKFIKEFQASKFWERPSYRDMPEGKDGHRVVLEALDHGRYHIVDRFGSDDEEFERLCDVLLDWAPLQLGDKYFLQLDQRIGDSLARKRQADREQQTP